MQVEQLQQQTHRALILFIALSKVQNESYTHFLGMFKHADKQAFNDLITASNRFCNGIKKNLPTESVKATDDLEAYFQDFCFTLIQESEFNFDKHSQVKAYLNELNTENNYHINETLKLIELNTSKLENNV